MSTKTRKKGPSPKRPNSGNARQTPKARRGKAWTQARRKRRMAGLKTAAAVGLGVVALGAIFVLSNSGGSKGTGQAGEYEFVVGNPGPGEKAPPLQLPSTNGGMFDLASEGGQSVLLYFQEGIMCQPCWDQIKDIEAEFSKFEALGVDKVVTITTDPLDALEQKAADESLTSEVLADPGVGASKEWGTAGIGMMGPQMNGHSFILVNEDGVIEWRADYGGPPDHTMYLPVSNVLADMRAALGSGASS